LAVIYKDYISLSNKKLDALDKTVKELMRKSSSAEGTGNAKESEMLMADAEAYHKVKRIVKTSSFYVSAESYVNEFDKKYPDMASTMYLSDPSNEQIMHIIANKRNVFESKMQEFTSQRKLKERDRCVDYIKALDILLVNRREAGDFDGVSVIAKEHERFAQNQVIIVNEASPELNSLTKQFIAREHEENRKIDIALISYVDEYVAELNKQVSEETKANNLQVAAVIDAERKRIQALVEIVEIRGRLQ
jgi:hypothetical protein